MTLLEKIYDVFLRSAGICTDSRKLKAGELYWSLKGERFDGNDFALDAIKAGAVGAITSNAELKGHAGIIVVQDGLLSLQDLATYHRKVLNIPIIALTGSNGKTTTKELIATVLSSQYIVGVTQGNFNNHIGVPLTLLSFKPSMDFGVVEMGANHVGEIKLLCEIARPDIGLITNIGKAHLEGFGGIEGVKKGKGEMYDFLKANGGLIVLNEDEPFLRGIAEGAQNILSFNDSFVVMAEEKVWTQPLESSDYCGVQLTGNKQYEIRTALVGGYNYRNVLMALQVAGHLGISVAVAAKTLDGFGMAMNRSQLVNHAGNDYIMDAYNANPTSMNNALTSFFNSTGEREKKVVVLGDMLELGPDAIDDHKNILDLLVAENVETVLCVGPIFLTMSKDYPFHFFNEVKEAKAFWRELNLKGYKVLVKGSRAIGLERLIESNLAT